MLLLVFFYVRDANLCMSYSLHNETLQTDNSDETGGCIYSMTSCSKIVSEYDLEMPQSQTADNPMAPQGRATQPSRDARKTN